ncbi:MAG: NAD(+) diphosphatase [Pseudomonadota bacterium]
MTEHVHTYAGNPLERGEALRRDEDHIRRLQQSAEARFLPFLNLKVAVNETDLDWQDRKILEQPNSQVIFLGMDESESPLFAVHLQTPPENQEFADCRLLASQLSLPNTGILAQARAQLDWHQRNPFCAQCGGVTHSERGGQIRRCQQCEKHIFPRTDGVAIMLIVDEVGGDRCLLGKGHGRMARANFYSCLAGFIDQGESLEEAVRREVWEEAGIRVGPVQYHSSQPWPFPSQLMIGCHGIALHKDINFDPVEMSHVDWFSRSEVNRALAGDHPTLNVPGPMAIAHHLIRTWADGEIEL